MPFFGTTPFAAPGLGIIASVIMLGFGLWWLWRAEARARKAGEGFGTGGQIDTDRVADDQIIREHATVAREFDPAEIRHGRHSEIMPSIGIAVLPLGVVIVVNLAMALFVLPRLDFSYLAEERWGGTTLSGVLGVWSVAVALAAAILTLIVSNRSRLPSLRETMDAGANASVLPIMAVASLVGFGAVVASLPAFAIVREAVLSVGGGPLVSLAVATNVLAALDRLGFGRDDDRARRARRHLSEPCCRARDRSSAAAPCRGHGFSHARHSAAQRGDRDLAGGVRNDAPPKLFRHCDGRDRRRSPRACRGDHARHCLRVILTCDTLVTRQGLISLL